VLTPIVTELVNNAIRYTTQPQCVDPWWNKPASVDIQAGADAHTVFIRVCDRGVGIDPTDWSTPSNGSGEPDVT